MISTSRRASGVRGFALICTITLSCPTVLSAQRIEMTRIAVGNGFPDSSSVTFASPSSHAMPDWPRCKPVPQAAQIVAAGVAGATVGALMAAVTIFGNKKKAAIAGAIIGMAVAVVHPLPPPDGCDAAIAGQR